MKLSKFSEKQRQVMTWWLSPATREHSAIICDGAVRSGKTVSMGLSFVLWSMAAFNGCDFGICGKTIRSVRRNLAVPLLELLNQLGFASKLYAAESRIEISRLGVTNNYYLFGGKDESSASLIQGITLGGVLLDEAALMPRSFVEQALARCSLTGSRLWFNCNPEGPEHWFYREWIKKAPEKNVLYIHFTMKDNPSLSDEVLQRYEQLYSGIFYHRYILGEWVRSEGLVYPFINDGFFCDAPKGEAERYVISCDYGTVNPTSMGLWGLYGGSWYRLDEYYFDSRAEGIQRTDEEHYIALKELAKGKNIARVIVDPSAASFMEVIRRHGEFTVVPGKNSVLDGIRRVGVALKQGEIKICRSCTDSIREFALYRWKDNAAKDEPIKENDHAMDDIRYFVTTELAGQCGFMAFSIKRPS